MFTVLDMKLAWRLMIFDAVILDQEVKFYTYHHVREQSEELFGFSSLAAKKTV